VGEEVISLDELDGGVVLQQSERLSIPGGQANQRSLTTAAHRSGQNDLGRGAFHPLIRVLFRRLGRARLELDQPFVGSVRRLRFLGLNGRLKR
jgi:hypothetical protein